MNKLMDTLLKILGPIAAKANRNKELSAIKDAMVATVPVTIVGALIMIITNFPYLNQFAPGVAAWLSANLGQISKVTISMLTIVVLISCSCSYAKQLKIDKMYAVIVAFIAFFILADFSFTGTVTVNGEAVENAVVTGVIPTSSLGSGGIFGALFTTLISLRIYSFVKNKNLTIKLPEVVPPNVSGSFVSLVPMLVVALVFVVIRDLFQLTPYGYFANFLTEVLTKPLLALGDSIWVIMLFILVQQLLWFLGIHGANIVRAVWDPIMITMMTANLEAFEAGQPLPYIVSQSFWNVYSAVFNFSIPLAMILFCKSVRGKTMGKVSAVPAAFCIHEPLIFGTPIVLNPILMIPFVFVYLLQFILVYVMAVIGISPKPVAAIPWTTPIILSGFLSTNFNIMGALIQILLIAVGIIGYYPFIKLLDRQYLEEEKAAGGETANE